METKEFEEYLREFDYQLKIKSRKANITGMDKEDIYQECALHLWVKKEEFNPKKSVFCAWADKVCNNFILDLIKGSKTKKASYLNDASDIDDEIEKEAIDF